MAENENGWFGNIRLDWLSFILTVLTIGYFGVIKGETDSSTIKAHGETIKEMKDEIKDLKAEKADKETLKMIQLSLSEIKIDIRDIRLSQIATKIK